MSPSDKGLASPSVNADMMPFWRITMWNRGLLKWRAPCITGLIPADDGLYHLRAVSSSPASVTSVVRSAPLVVATRNSVEGIVVHFRKITLKVRESIARPDRSA